MSSLNEDTLRAVLGGFQDRFLQQDWMSAHCIKAVVVEQKHVRLTLTLPYPNAIFVPILQAELTALLDQVWSGVTLELTVETVIHPRQIQAGLKRLGTVKNTIAVGSGKGGVGKSTTAVNIAAAWAAQGARVAILDADIQGPNQPLFLGIPLATKPAMDEQSKMQPIWAHGMQSNSMGYLVEADAALVWRGPMVSSAVEQLFYQTAWEDVDFLIIDLPPGTGDIPLTLAKKLPLTGVVVVTTPQPVSLADANRAIDMFDKVNVPVLGVVENWSYYVCPCCDTKTPLFGEGGGSQLAESWKVPLLGSLPLESIVRECGDRGTPVVLAEPKSAIASAYHHVAGRVAGEIARLKKDYSGRLPGIVKE